MLLNEITEINVALKNCKADKIKVLHNFIFDFDSGRSNRKEIRNFAGFDFAIESHEYTVKLKDINQKFSLNELIMICNILSISYDGTKPELGKRILSLLCDIPQLAETVKNAQENISDSESETDDLDEQQKNKNVSMQHESVENNCSFKHDLVDNSIIQKVNINYQDIESTITKFNAESYENILFWLEHFENTSKLFGLTDLQKFIFAKRSLGGNALLFVRGEPEIDSYQKLKEALIDEFSVEINSASLHEMLARRRMTESESVQEYFLKMKELSSHGKMDQAALIQYVVRGINDKPENKMILYGCKTLVEFKEKLKVYEVMKNDSARSKGAFDKMKHKYDTFRNYDKMTQKYDTFRNYDKNKQKYENDKFNLKNANVNKGKIKSENSFANMTYNSAESHSNKTCFNCGEKNHISKYCVYKDKGLKCFRCESFGHKAAECPGKNSEPDVEILNIDIDSKLSKEVVIGGLKVNALIDTGSPATLLRKSIYDKLNFGELQPLNTTLSGFGKSRVRPLGYFKGTIQIDDFECNTDIWVVENKVMPFDGIVGLNVLMQAETIINERGIMIRGKPQYTGETSTLSIFPIDLNFDEVEVNVEPVVSSILKNKVPKLIPNCVPQKTETSNTELNILVKNDESVSNQLLRFPFSEKKVVEARTAEVKEYDAKFSSSNGSQTISSSFVTCSADDDDNSSHRGPSPISTNMEEVIKEKGIQIKELTEEGQKLCKKKRTAIIKKPIPKEEEMDKTIKSLAEKLDDNSKEVERLKKSIGAKKEQEKKHIDDIRQLSNTMKKLEKEVILLKSNLEDSTEKELSLKESLDSTYKELTDLRKSHAAKEKELEDLKAGLEVEAYENSRQMLENAHKDAANEKAMLLLQIQELQCTLFRTEEVANLKEKIYKVEIASLQKRLRETEERNEDLTKNISPVTRPLVRQIENLQTTYNAQTISSEKIEKNLTDRLSDDQNQFALTYEEKRSATEKYMEFQSKMTNLLFFREYCNMCTVLFAFVFIIFSASPGGPGSNQDGRICGAGLRRQMAAQCRRALAHCDEVT